MWEVGGVDLSVLLYLYVKITAEKNCCFVFAAVMIDTFVRFIFDKLPWTPFPLTRVTSCCTTGSSSYGSPLLVLSRRTCPSMLTACVCFPCAPVTAVIWTCLIWNLPGCNCAEEDITLITSWWRAQKMVISLIYPARFVCVTDGVVHMGQSLIELFSVWQLGIYKWTKHFQED